MASGDILFALGCVLFIFGCVCIATACHLALDEAGHGRDTIFFVQMIIACSIGYAVSWVLPRSVWVFQQYFL